MKLLRLNTLRRPSVLESYRRASWQRSLSLRTKLSKNHTILSGAKLIFLWPKTSMAFKDSVVSIHKPLRLGVDLNLRIKAQICS